MPPNYVEHTHRHPRRICDDNSDDDDNDRHRQLRRAGSSETSFTKKKKSERGALFRVIDRVYSNVIGQAILRLLPPRPGVPGHHRLRI